jgi:hypothetical protein
MDTKEKSLTVDNKRRQIHQSAVSRSENGNHADATRWLRQLAGELFGAIEDHRKWIASGRARTLGTVFEVTGRLLTYGAYLALAYLAVTSYLDIRGGIAAGIYAIRSEIGGSRVALFNILAAGLVGPIAVIGTGIGVGWVYNLTVASANRLLPRFVRPLVHPSIMIVVVATFGVYQAVVSSIVATGFLYGRANIAAASPQHADAEKVMVISAPAGTDVVDRDTSSERELLRLRSIFNNRRPCPQEGTEPALNAQTEASRPEPGFAPSSDCQAEQTSLQK